MKAESTQDVITGFAEKRLCDKPKPEILIPDNAKTFQSREMHEFCNSTDFFSVFLQKVNHGHMALSSQQPRT